MFFTALSWSRSLTHNAVNSSNSLCDASCTMLHDASCQFRMNDVHRAGCRMHDVRCQHCAECTMSDVNIVYLEWTLDNVWCPEHHAKCTMSTSHIVQRLDDVLCTMWLAQCTMSQTIVWNGPTRNVTRVFFAECSIVALSPGRLIWGNVC